MGYILQFEQRFAFKQRNLKLSHLITCISFLWKEVQVFCLGCSLFSLLQIGFVTMQNSTLLNINLFTAIFNTLVLSFCQRNHIWCSWLLLFLACTSFMHYFYTLLLFINFMLPFEDLCSGSCWYEWNIIKFNCILVLPNCYANKHIERKLWVFNM